MLYVAFNRFTCVLLQVKQKAPCGIIAINAGLSPVLYVCLPVSHCHPDDTLVSLPFTCSSGLVAHSDLDERAIEALKEFNEEGALQVLVQFKESDLSHVQVSETSTQCKMPSYSNMQHTFTLYIIEGF